MKLRAHHLLCQLGFRGKGYDENFVKNMNTVIAKLSQNPHIEVLLTNECDIICSKCPNQKNNYCLSDEGYTKNKRIKQMDNYVLQILGYTSGNCYPFIEIEKKIIEKFKIKHMEQLCKHCEWKHLKYCETGLINLQRP